MHIAIGTDHAGFELKQQLVRLLRQGGHAVTDVGAHEYDADDDYPDSTFAVADAVAAGTADRGVAVCGSGVGACIAANKVRGVRACVCHDTYTAHQGVEHDDMNVICLGGKVVGVALAAEILEAFLGASFSGEPRHRRRAEKVRARDVPAP